MNVIFLCILMGNPYADRLVEALAPHDVNVKIEESTFNFIFLPKVLNRQRTHILHLHTIHYFLLGSNSVHRWVKFLIFISQLLVLKLFHIKIIWTVHEWTDRFGDGKHRIYPLWASILGRLFDSIIAHCDSTKTEIEQAFGLANTNQVFVIPHGNYIGAYDNHFASDQARQMLGIPEQGPVFLLFGDIHRTKGFLVAIDAFKKLEADNTFLLVVGQPSEEQLEKEIKSKIELCHNVLFIPRRIPNEEIQLYMNAADCVIVPYQVSTTSGVTILSMSFGKACIAPEVGFFKDVLDDSGAFLYDPSDSSGLLDALGLATDHSDKLAEMGKYNLSLAEQWSWNRVAENTFNVYQHCSKAK